MLLAHLPTRLAEPILGSGESLARVYIHVHIPIIRFSWDPHKSARNFTERGFDFAFASQIFIGPTLERPDLRHDYGEVRRIAMGRVASVTLTVIFTDRFADDGVPERRIISARVSTRRERKVYDQAYPQVD